MEPELLVTLWPTFAHFSRFANDPLISGVRLNTAKISVEQLDEDFTDFQLNSFTAPLWFDIKGRQLRIEEVCPNKSGPPDIILNHQIYVKTPTRILLKAGADSAEISTLSRDGRRLSLCKGPFWNIESGESVHIRDSSLWVFGETFTSFELTKIEKARQAGFTRYFLSYVETQRDVDQFSELVGHDSEVWLKI